MAARWRLGEGRAAAGGGAQRRPRQARWRPGRRRREAAARRGLLTGGGAAPLQARRPVATAACSLRAGTPAPAEGSGGVAGEAVGRQLRRMQQGAAPNLRGALLKHEAKILGLPSVSTMEKLGVDGELPQVKGRQPGPHSACLKSVPYPTCMPGCAEFRTQLKMVLRSWHTTTTPPLTSCHNAFACHKTNLIRQTFLEFFNT